jgi:hypothetical protein
VNACAYLSKRKSANSTKKLERAVIPFNLLLFNATINFLNCYECVTAGCKAFSLANEQGTDTNDWVIRSLD